MRSRLAAAGVLAALVSCNPTQTDLGTQEQAVQVCPGANTVQGIDVSDYQKQIDWDQVKGAGYLFAFTQINDGTTNDGTFAYNWSEMKRVGIIRGAYQFYEPSMDSAWQAQLVVNAVGALGDGDLPVALDVEWPSWGGSPSAAGIQTWVDAVTAGTGKVPIIYTALGYWDSYFNGQFSNLTLWVANYGVSCPNLPNGWSGWTFWQPDGVIVPGINTGNTDHDIFNGTLSDLQYIANAPGGSFCSSAQLLGCGGFGCNCADGNCSGGFCPGTGCSAQSTTNCGAFGCNCVDGKCNGGYCPGTGCTAKEVTDCGNFGCQCVDHQCNGGFCPGAGCTAKEITDCGNFGCQCVDHQCSGGFCPGQGCTAKESTDCTNQGCGCVDHKCSGGSCAGTGCTAKESTDCTNAGQSCAGGKCVANMPPDASVLPEPPDAATPAGRDASLPPGHDASVPPTGLDASEPPAGLDASQPPSGRDASLPPSGLDASTPPSGYDASTSVRHDTGVVVEEPDADQVQEDTDAATAPAAVDSGTHPASGDAGSALKGDGSQSTIEANSGCSCGTTPGSPGFGVFALVGLFLWRSRRRSS